MVAVNIRTTGVTPVMISHMTSVSTTDVSKYILMGLTRGVSADIMKCLIIEMAKGSIMGVTTGIASGMTTDMTTGMVKGLITNTAKRPKMSVTVLSTGMEHDWTTYVRYITTVVKTDIVK